jgi:outer membrane protein OmpA-like peptidoglycan-associated protein
MSKQESFSNVFNLIGLHENVGLRVKHRVSNQVKQNNVMKTKFLLILLMLFCVNGLRAQVDVDVDGKVNREANQRANSHVDHAIDKGFDTIEDGVKSLFSKKNKKDKKGKNKGKAESDSNEDQQQVSDSDSDNSTQSEEEQVAQEPKMDVQWSKFDFVPGDEVIFEDAPSMGEENGEFPSRWDLVKGQVEIAKVNGENVMMFIDGSPEIVPYLKNSKEDYLPEVFTIEFDFYKPQSGNRITVYLYDKKNQKYANSLEMDISSGGVSEKLAGVSGSFPGIDYSNKKNPRWIHVSIAFTKGKLKVYMDDTRVINIPHYSGNPKGLTLQAYWADLGEDKAYYFKNVRIAKGGVKYYDRMIQDGKIVCNGIRFDVGKASLKAESMGPINKIFELMQNQADIKFSVEVHTDSDGENATNQSLSEARAKSVMNKLISMGISADRLKSQGFGESVPVAENTTPEGKANNRRVEFVKF